METKPMTSTARHGFTMIEMLMVITIIAVLSGMIVMAGISLLGDANKKKTGVIIAAIAKGLELTKAERGGSVSPTEHPFAGSRETRFPFKRAFDSSDVATSGLAFRGADLSQIDGSANGRFNVLADDDVFNDKRVPMLFGAKREVMGILGATQKLVTKYVLLPKPGQSAVTATNFYGKTAVVVTGADGTSTAFPVFPNDSAAQVPGWFPDSVNPTTAQDADITFGLAYDNKRALDYVFGASGVGAELSQLKALASAPDTDPSTPAEKRFETAVLGPGGSGVDSFTPPSGLGLDPTLTAARVFTNAATDSSPQVSSYWKPGYIKHGTGYKQYRLPGLAVYDAWGREILYTISSKGGIRLISAGADGVLKFDPGNNHTLDTTLAATPLTTLPQGDDKDGSKDNVVQAVEDL